MKVKSTGEAIFPLSVKQGNVKRIYLMANVSLGQSLSNDRKLRPDDHGCHLSNLKTMKTPLSVPFHIVKVRNIIYPIIPSQ